MDFQTPCSSPVAGLYTPHCSDVSDDDTFEEPNFE